MKTRFHQITATLLAASILVAMASAQQASGSGSLQAVEPMNAVLENFTLKKIAGRPVLGTHQETLSTIEDYLIDPRSGRIHFAVVPAGSNTFRIVPIHAIMPRPGEKEFSVQRTQAEWNQVGTMTAEQLNNLVHIDDDHQQRLARQFALRGAESAAVGLMRASSLEGRVLTSGQQQLGVIDGIVIDYNNTVAAPVLALSGGAQKFTVPMSQLQIMPGRGAITTNLTPKAFPFAQWPHLAPTGNVSLDTSASAVQQALQREASLPQGSVQVIPERRLILRGIVQNEQQRANAERAAQQAAPGVRIENQLSVRNW